MQEKIYIPSSHYKLSSIFTRAEMKSRNLIIMAHGFAGNKDESGFFIEFAKELALSGYNSLRFDFFGCGESEGDFLNANLSMLDNDLISVYNYARRELIEFSDNIVLLGFSLGAAVIVRMINKNHTYPIDPIVKGLIFLAPAFFPYLDMFPRYNTHSIQKQLSKIGYIRKGTVYVSNNFINKSLKRATTERLLPKLRYAVLILHGDNDPRINVQSSNTAHTLIQQSTFYPIQSTSHSFKTPVEARNKVFRTTIDWLKNNIPQQLSLFDKWDS